MISQAQGVGWEDEVTRAPESAWEPRTTHLLEEAPSRAPLSFEDALFTLLKVDFSQRVTMAVRAAEFQSRRALSARTKAEAASLKALEAASRVGQGGSIFFYDPVHVERGYARWQPRDGFLYEGGWRGNSPFAYGVLALDGTLYRGQFRSLNTLGHDPDFGMLHRLRDGYGVLRYRDGSIYAGHLMHGKRHGHGFLSSDGLTYAGEFRDGLRHGSGKLSKSDGSTVFVGQFRLGQRAGFGVEGRETRGFWQKGVLLHKQGEERPRRPDLLTEVDLELRYRFPQD